MPHNTKQVENNLTSHAEPHHAEWENHLPNVLIRLPKHAYE